MTDKICSIRLPADVVNHLKKLAWVRSKEGRVTQWPALVREALLEKYPKFRHEAETRVTR